MSGHQRLAVAVLRVAYRELIGRSKQRFFAPDEWCQFWCDVADVGAQALCARIRGRRNVH